MKKKGVLRRWSWPLGILILAAAVSVALVWTAPETKPEEKTRSLRVVQVASVKPVTESVAVEAQGTVIPARRVTIVPQVGGRIEAHHSALLPGGFIQVGEEIVQIDPSDYRIALTEKEAAAEQAIFEQAIERGRQVVASREWELLADNLGESEVNRELVLREPHLRRTESLIRMATNEIARAKLDLARTSISAPFNSIVLEENVEVGQVVDAGAPACVLAGADEFWVQATLPVDKLQWIRLPNPGREGAPATVILDPGGSEPVEWQGTVIRLLSDLDPVGRMARVLIEVKDPLGLKSERPKIPLLLGSFVQIRIDAGTLPNVLVIPRSALREGNNIWIADSQDELQVRSAEILWLRQDTVLIKNVIEPGEQLIVSDLKTPLPGMKVNPQPLAVSTPVQSREASPASHAPPAG